MRVAVATLLRMPKIAGHLWPAQIQVAILEPQLLIHLASHFRIVHRKRQYLGVVQQLKRLGHDLDLARRNLRVIGAVGARSHFARHADHAFAPQRGGLLEKVFRQVGRVKHRLGAPLSVAHVNEDQPA